ncbi:MAG: hypothetical protein Q8L74_12905 [Nitrospirota bacterium]|nr:hypothetical protein [Nitrospirota bacterium]MDP2382330.1 hypothetical protein [Nitrospirota bacterium]MDP3596112.1 hypothetical protein [Nitrospirota bacterium]
MWGRGNVDGGKQWMVVTLALGRYALVFRATDGEGTVQTSIEQDPAPDGATGLHEISVTVARKIFTRFIFRR